MSRLIDSLIATAYPDRSKSDLTWEYGEWLEKNDRQDIFLANPDFSAEYFQLKDEISRARRPSYVEEFKGALGSAFDHLQESGFAIGALAAHGAKAIGIPGAEPVQNKLLELMREQGEQAAEYQPSVGSYKDITNTEDLGRFGTYALGTIVPSLGQAAASGLAGAAVGGAIGGPGGAVGGALLGLAERRLAQKAVSKLLADGVKTVTLEQAAKAIPRAMVEAEAKRLAVQYGAQAALAASSIQMETGSIYAENPEAPWHAVGYGIPAGLLDVLPEAYIASRFLSPAKDAAGEAVKKSVGYFRRFAGEAAKLVPLEGTTEAAQTLLEIAAAKHGRGEPPTSFTDDDYTQMVNAGIIGGIAGLALGPISAFANPSVRTDPTGRVGEAVVERLPYQPAEMPIGSEESFGFGGEIPEMDLVGRSTLPAETQAVLAAEERVGFEGFNPGEEAPYQLGAAETPAVKLPQSFQNAVANAQEAVDAWEAANPAPEPLPGARPPATFDLASIDRLPPSAEVTDAPLGNLIGVEVEYSGYRGTLIRDREGAFLVQRTVGDTRPVEIADTGKDPSIMASAVGVVPLAPANMTPKPAPSVVPPAAPAVRREPSKVLNLEELFPRDPLAPRSDIVVPNRTQPGEVLAAANVPIPPAPEAPGATAPIVPPPLPPAPGVAPAAPVLKPEPQWVLIVQQPPEEGAPGYVQIDVIDEQGNNTESLTKEDFVARGGALPDVSKLPTGRYRFDQLGEALAQSPVITTPTGEQAAAAGSNGVPPIARDLIPNLQRVKTFSPSNLAADFAELKKRVGKSTKGNSRTVAIIVDNETGQAFMRLAYEVDNTVYVDRAYRKVGRTSAPDADFLKGTEGGAFITPSRSFGIATEKSKTTGLPRYTLWGVGTLKTPGLLEMGANGNGNMGAAADLVSHPGVIEANKAENDTVAADKNAAGSPDKMPAATVDNMEFVSAMAEWRRKHRGAKPAEAMLARAREHVEVQVKTQKYVGVTAAQKEEWAKRIAHDAEIKAGIEEKQTTRISADFIAAPASAIDVMQSALRALSEGGDVDVVAFEQAAMGAVNSAAQTTGFVLTPQQDKKIVAFGIASINGPVSADRVISVLHETAHVVTDGLPEPLRVAFQDSVGRMPWQQARWLMNPRSMDIRLLANAEPSQLSPEQQAALQRLTAEEIAAARRIDPTLLLEEQMTEHLAQVGWDKSEAKGVIQSFIRLLKELWFNLAMAVQKTFKGPDHISPALARAYVENRFLQFIHRDSALARDRINDLKNWLGVPLTPRQMVPYFPVGSDADQRMQYVDVVTGRLIPVGFAPITPDAQRAYLKTAIEHAANWVKAHPADTTPDTPELRFTKRAYFNGVISNTPTIRANSVFAALNQLDETFRRIQAHRDIGPFIPRDANFYERYLRLPVAQLPATQRSEFEATTKEEIDPLTGAPVAYDADTTIDKLPAIEEPIVDRENRPVTINLTEAQDKALNVTMAGLSDTEARVQRRANYETDRIADLKRQQKRNPAEFSDTAQAELDELSESLPLLEKIAARLQVERKALLSKFNPRDKVNVNPTATYPTIPGPNATEAEILAAPQGVVPRDYKYADKSILAGHLSAMDAWLRVPENQTKGAIYGTIAEWYRKLNDIPTDLRVAGTAALLRKTVTGNYADELRHGGLRALQFIARKIYEVADVINTHNERLAKAGSDWDVALNDFAKALGDTPGPAFKERVWDPLRRVWELFDVSERNKLGTAGEGDFFATMEKALKHAAGITIDSDAKRSALRALLMRSIEGERQIRTVYEQYPGLKVHDKVLDVYRRLIPHGLVTGQRGMSQHILGLYMRMMPEWSATKPMGPDGGTFWEAAGTLYRTDRKAFDAQMARLFEGYTISDFVDPLMNNNVQIFDVADPDGVIRKASLLRVRQAWREAQNDVTRFAERLHELEGGKPGEEGATVQSVLNGLRSMFAEIKGAQDARVGTEKSGREILPRQMMDARVAENWPAEWVSYSGYGKVENLSLLHQLAIGAAFGPDAIAGTGELASTIREAKADLAEMYAVFNQHYIDGKSLAEIERLMGSDEFRVAKNSAKITSNLGRVEAAFRQMSSVTNYLSGDFTLANDILGLASSMMIGSPRGGMINTIGDLLGPLVAMKFSRQAFAGMKEQIHSILSDVGNSTLQAFGQDAVFNVDFLKRLRAAGVSDPDTVISWRDKLNNHGPGASLGVPSGYESGPAKVIRNLRLFTARARDILPNLGSPLQGTTEMKTLSPKLRATLFGTTAYWTMNANIKLAYKSFTDLALRGVNYINTLPATERNRFVAELEGGVRNLDAQQLGYFGSWLLNDKAAFDSLRNALETKIAGEKGVGSFVAKAYRRSIAADGAAWNAISNSQFTGIINYANTEWTLQSNFASLPHFMQGPFRPLFIFITWPYNAMGKFKKTFLDPEGRIGRDEQGKIAWWGANSTIADGMKTFFLLSAPITVAGSFAIDWYDKYLLGKKQNLREATWKTAIPIYGAVTDPLAFMERVGRYGSGGLATDAINMAVNYDTQRNMSLDDRIVAINAISSMVNALAMVPFQQRGNITYASVGRPFFQAIGGGGVLQYLQVMANLLGLDNQDAAINARINTGNYLRGAGRVLGLPVRIYRGAEFVPTPISPYLQQMELAALINNEALFRSAYRNAVEAARDHDHKDDAERYVASNFASRHPLRRLFKGVVSDSDYRRMLAEMGEYGAGQVRASINSYNRYLTNWFGKPGYYGKADRGGPSVDQLIREATRINSDIELESEFSLSP